MNILHCVDIAGSQ